MKLITRKLFLFFFISLFAISAKAVTANFTADYISGCAPLLVNFTNTSTGATSYNWDLGNGTTSLLTNVSGTYITPGTYTVTLTAHNGSTTSVHTITITVFASPVISFVASDTSVCPGTSVLFTSTSSPGVPGPLIYLWNFGDGFTSAAPNPSHVYATPGFYNVSLTITNSQGCSTTRTITGFMHIFNKPTPAFSAPVTYFCSVPGAAVFTGSATGTGPFTYDWKFGDGGTGTGSPVNHNYTAIGGYSVKLTVTDGNGCTDTLLRPNYIFVSPMTAAFTFPPAACMFTTVTFPNTSSPHTTSSWSFGDGGTSSTDTGYHVYSAAGTYIVRLIVSNGYCSDTETHSILIRPQPTGSFTMNPIAPCPAPATISFAGTTTPPGGLITWLYGDGGSGSGSSTSHTYAANGSDTVKMIITDGFGCKDTVSQVANITGFIFNITGVPASGCVPLNVGFSASIGTTTGGVYPYPVSNYSWNYGDGSAVVSGAVPTPTHIFTAVGIYSVICVATTSNGCVAHDTVIISVGRPPVVDFVVTPTHICYNSASTYTAHIISGPVDVYHWDFGDGSGTTDSGNATSHHFTIPGTFSSTLTAYYNGCPSVPFVVSGILVDSPKSIIVASYGCTPYTRVQFGDSSLGDDTHVWMFGDATTSTLDNPAHTYPAPAIYIAYLATYNATSGCRDTSSIALNLIPPVLTMHADDTAVCVGEVVHFTPTVTGSPAVRNFWDVNGVCLDNDTNAAFTDTFRVPGFYSIRYRIQDAHGCFDTAQHLNWILVAKPVDSFSAAPIIGCAPLTVNFTDLSTFITGTSAVNYKWAYGDGGTATIFSPGASHTYTAAGTYSVQSIVTDNLGCKDTVVRPALITVWRPHAQFVASNGYPCIGASIHFTNLSVGITGSYWMFGDGDTSTLAAPDHAYSAVGAYTVKLVVYDTHGCSDTAVYTNYINVTRPHAAFYMDDSFSICPPLTVHYFNTSTGSISYNWAFGDGGTSILNNPSDVYTTPNVYTVTLVATNSHGCKDTAYGHVNIVGSLGGFSYTPLSGCTPLTVHFSASLSNVPNIIWDFTDGTTSSTSFSDTTTHIYTVPGAYVPKLLLSDNTGCQSSSLGIDTIKVDAVRPGFTTNPFPVCINSNISFVDTSGSYFSTIGSWHWIFSPTDTSNIASPAHLYTATGSYPVSLVVTDGWGCTGSVTKNVVVNPPPVITACPDTTVCVGDYASLSAAGGVSYTWAPPATLSCTACLVTHASPVVITTYTVTGADANGCLGTDTVTVFLRTNTISAGWGDTEVCQHVGVPLFDTGGTKYTWIPAAGLSNASIYNPIASPDVTTQYTVVAQLGSCIPDTNYVTVIVHPLPTVDAGPNQILVAGSHAQLNATGTSIATYAWSPAATLSCSTCADPTCNNLNTQSYTITVASSFGCKAWDTVTIYLYCEASQVFIPNTFTPNADGENDVFYPRGGGVNTIKTFRIYNRWGELIFERTNIPLNDVSNAWDGSFNGAPPRPDVYVYLIDATCDTGEPIFIKGDVTIIR